MLEAPAKPIERPSHYHVELVASDRAHHAIECRALVAAFGAGDPSVLENFEDGPAVAHCNQLQGVDLIARVLLTGRYAGVDGSAAHAAGGRDHAGVNRSFGPGFSNGGPPGSEVIGSLPPRGRRSAGPGELWSPRCSS
jgi:hypothetical protein